MNRTALSRLIYLDYESINTDDAEKLADFILANFEPKQPKTERVTAKEVFLALTANSASSHTRWEELIPMAHEGAEAFNNSLIHE